MPDASSALLAVESSLARVVALGGDLHTTVDAVLRAAREAQRHTAEARSSPVVHPVGSMGFLVERLGLGLDELVDLLPPGSVAREQADQCRLICATMAMMTRSNAGGGPE